MKIFDYFRSLLPSFERSRISEDVTQLRSEVNDNLLPAFKGAVAVIGSKPLQVPFAKAYTDLFKHLLPEYARFHLIEGLYRVFETLPAKLDLIDQLVETYFAKDVTKETITYRKASLLRYLEIMHFSTTFASRSLLRLLAAETNIATGKPEAVDVQLTPAEAAWFAQNQNAFFDALRLVALPVDQLRAALESIPDIVIIPEKASLIKQTVGEDKIDPLRMGFISAGKWPIYHIRLMLAERQVREYKAKLELKRQLEFRILALREAYQGKQDPKLQQAIEYSEGRLQKLSYELQEMESDYS